MAPSPPRWRWWWNPLMLVHAKARSQNLTSSLHVYISLTLHIQHPTPPSLLPQSILWMISGADHWSVALKFDGFVWCQQSWMALPTVSPAPETFLTMELAVWWWWSWAFDNSSLSLDRRKRCWCSKHSRSRVIKCHGSCTLLLRASLAAPACLHTRVSSSYPACLLVVLRLPHLKSLIAACSHGLTWPAHPHPCPGLPGARSPGSCREAWLGGGSRRPVHHCHHSRAGGDHQLTHATVVDGGRSEAARPSVRAVRPVQRWWEQREAVVRRHRWPPPR